MPYRPKARSAKSTPRKQANRQTTKSDAKQIADSIRNGIQWQHTRSTYRSAHPLCEDPCGIHKRAGVIKQTQDIHHITPLTKRPDLAYEWSNLMAVCKECHTLLEGRPMSTQPHVVITGPPGSGKSTKAQELLNPHDILFDLDRIAESLNPTFARYQGRPSQIAYLILQYRRELIQRLTDSRLNGFRAIIIVTDQSDAENLAQQLNADLIVMEERKAE